MAELDRGTMVAHVCDRFEVYITISLSTKEINTQMLTERQMDGWLFVRREVELFLQNRQNGK